MIEKGVMDAGMAVPHQVNLVVAAAQIYEALAADCLK